MIRSILIAGRGGGGEGGEGSGCLFVGCLTSQQHASVSQGRVCSDNFTCCHTEIEVADQTFYLTKSQYTVTGQTSPSTDPITPAPGRVATGVPMFEPLVLLDPEKILAQVGFEPGTFRSRGGCLTTRPTRRFGLGGDGGGGGEGGGGSMFCIEPAVH